MLLPESVPRLLHRMQFFSTGEDSLLNKTPPRRVVFPTTVQFTNVGLGARLFIIAPASSPEVFYTYIPLEDQDINIDLCESGYDTKAYVYHEESHGLTFDEKEDRLRLVFRRDRLLRQRPLRIVSGETLPKRLRRSPSSRPSPTCATSRSGAWSSGRRPEARAGR